MMMIRDSREKDYVFRPVVLYIGSFVLPNYVQVCHAFGDSTITHSITASVRRIRALTQKCFPQLGVWLHGCMADRMLEDWMLR